MYKFTQEDLIQYLYNETSAQKTESIKNALIADWTLREKLEVLRGAKQQLDQTKLLSPRKQSVDAILEYSEKVTAVLAEHH